MHTDGDAYVNFRLGGEGFGIPLSQIREIAPVGEIAPVPLAPASIRGLANLKGRVVTLIDVAHLLSLPLPEARSPADRLALVLAPPWAHLALFVHAPVEIARADAAQPSRAAALAATAGGPAWTTTALHAESRPFNMISAADLVSRCEARVIEGFRRKAEEKQR